MDRLQVQDELCPGTSALEERTLRRRSTSPRIPRIETLPTFSSGINIDGIGEDSVPTIKRVHSSGSSVHIEVEDKGHKALDGIRKEKPLPKKPGLPQDADNDDAEPLDFVYLTPRPNLQDRAQTGASATTGITQISLPTPNYCAERRSSYGGVFDFFKIPIRSSPGLLRQDTADSSESDVNSGQYSGRQRQAPEKSQSSGSVSKFSVLKNYIRSVSFDGSGSSLRSHSSQSHRYQPFRTHSYADSTSSIRSLGSSVDSGKTHLLSGVCTTEKFTHKWPMPRALSRMNSGYSRIDVAEPYESVESLATGFGFEYAGSWTTHKWFLFFSVLSVFIYSIIALVYSVLTWYQSKFPFSGFFFLYFYSEYIYNLNCSDIFIAWEHADVMLVTDYDVLILITLSACLLLFSALVGLTGTLLNSRPLLAIYALLLWPALVAMLAVGYVGFKRAAFALDRKLNRAWSQFYTDLGRAVIQDSLRCCGFTDPTHEATYTSLCYPRVSGRPGCKGPLLRFERANLDALWRAAFAAAPLHMMNIVIALLCANHVTKTFGKGIMPRRYRLRAGDVKRDARRLLEYFAKSGKDTMGEGARRPPGTVIRAGLGCIREDREERFD